MVLLVTTQFVSTFNFIVFLVTSQSCQGHGDHFYPFKEACY